MILIVVLALFATPIVVLAADLARVRRPADRFAGDPVGPVRGARAAAAAPAAPTVTLVEPLPERRQQQLPFVGQDRRRSGDVDLRRPLAVPANMDAAALDAMLRDLGADPATTVIQRVAAG